MEREVDKGIMLSPRSEAGAHQPIVSYLHRKQVQSPGESKIPVKQPLGSKLVSLSQRVRASLGISDHPVKLLGLLGGSSAQPRIKEPKPQRPSSFHEPFPPRRWSEGSVCKRDVGKRVITSRGSGTLRFLGRCGLGPGLWAGIELDTPHGTNDGTVGGVKYFNCSPGRGLFVPQSEISFPPLKSEDKPPHPTPVDCERISSYLEARTLSPVMPLQDLSRNSKNSSSSSLVRVPDPEQSKHSSFEFDESLGILTPDQMDDFVLNMSDDLIKSPSLGVSSLITQEDLTLVSLTDSDRNSIIPSTSFSKFSDTIIERDRYLDETNDTILLDSETKSPFPDFVLGDLDDKRLDLTSTSPGFEVKRCFEGKTNRTPSVEELPLDCEEQRDKDGSKSGTVPNSFVTSITSITSLDNGYQGDGEWSRPASRGADHSPSSHQKLLKPRMDPMTDSDFFTESDADMHDELVSGRGDRRAQVIDGTLYGVSSSNPPVSVHSQRFSPTCEEMDSSGIYSDFERRPEDLEIKSLSEEMEDVQLERVNSPTGSTRTFSSNKSDQSVKKLSPTSFSLLIKEQVSSIKNLMMEVDSSDTVCQTPEDPKPLLQPEQINHVSSPSAKSDTTFMKKHKMPKRNVVSKIKTMISSTNSTRKEEESNRTVKKGRWDAVMSKISQSDDRPRLKEVKSRVFSGLGATPPRVNSTTTTPPARTLSPRHLASSFQPATSTRSLRDIQTLKSCKGRRSRLRSSECLLTTPPPGSGQTPASSRNSSFSDVSQSIKTISSTRSVKKRDSVRSGSPQNEVSSAKKPAVSSPPKNKSNNGKGVQNGDKIISARKVNARTTTSSAVKQPTPSAKDGVLQSGGKVDKSAPRATSTSDVTPLRSAPPRALETPDISPILAETPTPDLLVPLSPLESPSIGLTPVKCQPEIRHDPVALGHLKHASLGVEALATLINHLVINYEAFSTPKLKQELEKTKSDWIQTRLQLEQASTTYRRLEEELSIERIKYQETETQHQNEIDDLRKVSRVNERRYEDLEAKLEQQEDELERLRQDHREEIECLNTSHREELSKATRERSIAENDYKQRIAELEKELNDIQLAHNNLKQSRQLFIDSLSSSEKETKLRAALQRNSELESEVNSLRSVLELRCSELQELRRTSQAWQLHADQLPLAKQTIANYKAKIEQLTEKLDMKEANELKMIKDIKTLNQSLNRGYEQNKRLSMLNEELTWKLKQNTKLVHVLANTVDQASYHSPEMREARLSHKITPFKASDDMELTLTTDRGEWLTPTKEIVRYNSTPGNSGVVNSSPSSHKVKGLVEKEDSVSWTLDMDEPVECVASRIIRRATSLRCDQSPRKVQERSRSSKSMSERTIKSEIKSNNKEVIVVKDDEELDLLVGPSEITIDDARLRPKSDEELEMLRRVEESGGSLPKDLAGEAMVSGETSDNDSDMVLDDSPIRSPRPVDLIAWHE